MVLKQMMIDGESIKDASEKLMRKINKKEKKKKKKEK